LSQKRTVPGASSILSLNPFLDKKGLVRACGRVTASDSLRYDERHPIILPYECALSRLLVKFTHLVLLHGGNQLVMRLTRSRYWVPRIKSLVKAVVNSCKVCVIHKKRLQVQMLGSFPKEQKSFFPSVHMHRDGLWWPVWYKKINRKSLSHYKRVCVGFRLFFYEGHPSRAYIRLNDWKVSCRSRSFRI